MPGDRANSQPGASMNSRLAALERMDIDALRREWMRVVKTTPHLRLSADLLRRGVAHRLQEAAYGGVTPRVLRKIAAGARNTPSAVSTAPDLKPGTILLREWHGRSHTVQVVEDGFDYDGQRFASLTAIARQITGAAWSGPRFFGVERSGTAFRADGETSHA